MCYECVDESEPSMSDKSKKNRVYKPEVQTLRLNERLLPELKGLEVGEEATITLKVRMKSKTEGNEWDMGGDTDWDERQYGKAYADAKRKDQALLKGSFEILEADEDGVDNSPEYAAAQKIMASKKKGRQI